MFYFCMQLEFSDDIVKIIQAAINSDGGQPEIKKANSMVKSFFIRVNEINSSWGVVFVCFGFILVWLWQGFSM